MTPYRRAAPAAADSVPELDRYLVYWRWPQDWPRLVAGSLIITPETLRYEPRIGRRTRVASIDRGVGALRLSRWTDVSRRRFSEPSLRDAVTSWQTVVASEPYEQLAPVRQDQRFIFDAHVRYVSDDGEVDNSTHYCVVLDDAHLVALANSARVFDACFMTSAEWPDRSARLLGRALAWLTPQQLHAAVERVYEHTLDVAPWNCRRFTRDEVRARRVSRYGHELGPQDDTVQMHPTTEEIAALTRWLGSDGAR